MNTLSAMPVDDGLLITAGGYEVLRAELEALRGHIGPELSERLRDARQDGHLADNPPLFDLLEEQAQLDRRIAVLEAQLAAAQIAAPATDGCAGIGSRVCVRDLEVGDTVEYELVGAIEPKVGDGRVSVAAPWEGPSSDSVLVPDWTLHPPGRDTSAQGPQRSPSMRIHNRGKLHDTFRGRAFLSGTTQEAD